MVMQHSDRSNPILLRENATIPVLLRIAKLLLVAFCLQWSALSQAPPAGAPALPNPFGTVDHPGGAPTFSTHQCVVIVTVRGENGSLLDRQAVVKMYNKNNHTVFFRTTQDQSIATFEEVGIGIYDIEVSAVGYITTHQDFKADRELHTYRKDAVIKPDPAEIDLILSSEMPSIPPKARKAMNGGISALKSGNLKGAEKKLEAAYKLAPSNADINFLMGYLSFQQNRRSEARNYLETATKFEPDNFQALSLLGRVYIQEEDFIRAKEVLSRAVEIRDERWFSHYLLAESYLNLGDYEKSRDEAQIAIQRGESASNVAQLILGEALAGLGKDGDAVQALKTYLKNPTENSTVPAVRDLIASINTRTSGAAAPLKQASIALPAGAEGDFEIQASELSTKSWWPPSVDDAKPPVATGVTCPYDLVINGAGEHSKQLLDNVSRFAATEDVVHQDLDKNGSPVTTVRRSYDYMAQISPGAIAIDEERKERSGNDPYPDHIAIRGLATLAFVFHPDIRNDFAITCEGLGHWNKRATWLLYFRQRPDRPNRSHEFKAGGVAYTASLKGRAWVAADTYEILRIESELVDPIPQLHLVNESQTVEYSPVLFPKKNIELWLPKQAEIYLTYNKRHYFRRHTFDHFILFSVDSEEKVGDTNDSRAHLTTK